MKQSSGYILSDISTISSSVTKPKEGIWEYSEILNEYGMTYLVDGYYLRVGEISKVQGWILHISIVKFQVIELLETVLPVLIKENIPFKIARNREVAGRFLDGSLNYTQLGKIVSIYPENDITLLSLAKLLIDMTRRFKSPAIPTDILLGGSVYTRYGSFNPVILTSPSGKRDKFIYDSKGQLVNDEYNIPFKLPKWVDWPFRDIKKPVVQKSKKFLNRAYLSVMTIKSDAKGKVSKAVNFNKIFSPDWCLIKEGKYHMSADDAGRDITDRLLWQQELHNDLSTEIPTPKIIDMFKESSGFYLVMEFIEGISLNDQISGIFNNNSWNQLKLSDQILLLNYLLSITHIIGQLHQKGYVHRDITPSNFLIDQRDQIFLVDMELTYSLKLQKPNPPFKWGTAGFMSPEQLAAKTPTIKEDIYGLGALMISIFTSLSPIKFGKVDADSLTKQLNFFINNIGIVNMIVNCLRYEPELRPTLVEISTNIQRFREDLASASKTKCFSISTSKRVDDFNLKTIIQGAINALSSPLMMTQDDLWPSKTIIENNMVGNEQAELSYYGGMHEGMSGVIYGLTKAKQLGFNVQECLNPCKKSWEFIENNYLKALPNIPPGLFVGAAGIGLTMAISPDNCLHLDEDEKRKQVQACLNLQASRLDFANGSAGQGIALIRTGHYLSPDFLDKKLNSCIEIILSQQEKEGSWVLHTPDKEKSKQKNAGFANGAAGILYFLLETYSQYPTVLLKHAIEKGLKWLAKQSYNGIQGFGVCTGSSGVALTFIKAYEIFKHPMYKQIAEKILTSISSQIVNVNFSQCMGLAGLGEVYLEAYRVFKTSEWYQRAEWITSFFIHTSIQQKESSLYWLADNTNLPTADLMTGNCGVIHFLLRYLYPHSLGFPFAGSNIN